MSFSISSLGSLFLHVHQKEENNSGRKISSQIPQPTTQADGLIETSALQEELEAEEGLGQF